MIFAKHFSIFSMGMLRSSNNSNKIFPKLSSMLFSTLIPNPPFLELLNSVILSRLSYSDNKSFQKSLEEDVTNNVIDSRFVDGINDILPNQPDMPTSFHNGNANTQAYAWCKSNVCYVVFRGTVETSITNWARNFLDKTQAFEGDNSIQVEEGFLRDFNSLKGNVTAFLDNNKSKYTSIKIAGHSLGGAMANLAGAYYSHKYKPIKVTVYTCGCPRVGGAAFNDYFQECVNTASSWRIYNELDAGPQFPDKDKEYTHVAGNALELLDNGGNTVHTEDNNGDIFSVKEFLNTFESAQQHKTSTYIDRLQKFC